MDGTKEDYKHSKEAFVSGATGSTVTHVNLISCVALCSIALYASARSRLIISVSSNLLSEWVILVLPLLLSMTLFAERPLLLCFLLLLPTFVLLVLPRKDHDGPPLSLSVSRTPSRSNSLDWTPPNTLCDAVQPTSPIIAISQLPSLTIYRAHMMLMTVLAILAVDFPIFSRSLAKCETFGVSLMDLGVGSFVFSQGVVSAIPLIKDATYLLAPLMPKVLVIIKKVLPLLILGAVRIIAVKGTEYPEHESEYGTHWNFFFTLAILPVLQVLLHPVIVHLPISFLGFSIALSHQLALSFTPLQRYTLNAPRTNFISANKEGLVSLTGYLAIHLLGLSVGTIFLPPSPSDFRRQQNKLRRRLRGIPSVPPSPTVERNRAIENAMKGSTRQDDKTVIELLSYAFLWWCCLALCYLTGLGGGISRRLTNLPYVVWVAAYNTIFIMFYLLLEKSLSSSKHSVILSPISPSSLHAPSFVPGIVTKLNREAPPLLQAFNLNGLAIFLLANVMTGLINLSMETMYASDSVAMLVLSAYSFALCLVAWTCMKTRLWKL